MMRHPTRRTSSGLLVAALASLVAVTNCVEGPSAPDDLVNPLGYSLVIAPVFSLVGPTGVEAQSAAQTDALDEAFDRVNRFRIIVRRASNNDVVVDSIITVSPGGDVYDFSFDVSAGPGETFNVSLTAFEGETELFEAPAITVTATPPAAAGGQTAPPSTNITLQYSGPGVTATSIQVTPTQLVVAPSGSGTLTGDVQDQSGTSIPNVPLGWASSVEAAATVAGGEVSGVSDGLTEITVTTPTGLEARAWAYVVGGELAYVEGGALSVRAPAGGDATTRAGDGSQPAWSPDGARLFYVSGGAVRLAGEDAALVDGSWPSVSPDGSKLAVESGGTVVFANDDGTNPTSGPSGSSPVWDDDGTVIVAGGSVQRVRADGEGRTTLAEGAAGAPARAADGSVAYVEDGALHVVGRTGDALLTGVTGRPSWSAGGTWLVAPTGSGLMLVSPGGEAPGVALPDLGGASDPAFKPSGALTSPPGVVITGFDPAEPRPGAEVLILGSGFDWVIPSNNAVVWPTHDGTEASAVTAATETSVTTTVPRAVAAGQVRVETRSGSALQAFDPMFAVIDVTALTPWAAPVSGVMGVLSDAEGAELERGATDDAGSLTFPGLLPGVYTVDILETDGFTLLSESHYPFDLGIEAALIELELTPLVELLTIEPEVLDVEVDGSLDVTLTPYDRRGDVIPEIDVRWLGGVPHVGASGDGLSGTIFGIAPSAEREASVLVVALGDQVFEFPVTVTSFIEGMVTQDPDPPARTDGAQPVAGATTTTTGEGGQQVVETEPGRGYVVEARINGETGDPLATGESDGTGRYKIPGLFEGEYEVRTPPANDRSPVPDLQVVTLGVDNPFGTADWFMSRAPVDFIVLDAGDEMIHAFDGTLTIDVASFDEDETPLGGRRASFNSLSPGIATVDPNTGVVTAVDNGTVMIEVTVEAVTDTITITVDQIAVSIEILDPDEGEEPVVETPKTVVGDTELIPYEALDANGHPIDPSHKTANWTSSDEGIMTVDGAGNVLFLLVGDVDLTAEMDGVSDVIPIEVYLLHTGNLFVTASASSGNIMNPADIAAARIGEVTGNLDITSTSLTSLAGLESIFDVGGSVLVEFNTLLTDVVGLMNIEYVGADVIFNDNDALTTPPPPGPAALEHVGGNFEVLGNALVTNLDVFANLTGIDGSLNVLDDPSFNDPDLFPNMGWIGGDVWLKDLPGMSSTGLLPGLTGIGGSVIIEGGGTVLGFPTLQIIPMELQVGGVSYNNNILEELYLPALQCIGDDLYIYGNQVLTTVSTPNLFGVATECGGPPPEPLLNQRRALDDWSLDFSHRVSLEARYGTVQQGAEALEERVGAEQQQIWERLRTDEQEGLDFLVEEEARRDAARPETTGVLSQTRGIQGQFDPLAINQARIGQLQQELHEQSEQRQATEMERAPREPRAEPQRTSEITPDIYVSNNPALTTLDFALLEYVEGYVQFYYNDVLSLLTFPSLTEIGTYLSIQYGHFTSLNFPALVTVGDDVNIYDNNPGLNFTAPLLEYIGNSLYVQDNDDLGDFILPSLMAVYYDVIFYDNTWNSVLQLPVLEYVMGAFVVQYNYGLSDIVIASSSLLDADCGVMFDYNMGLNNISMPGLRFVGGDGCYCGGGLVIEDNSDLRSVSIATTTTLETVSGVWVYSNTSYPDLGDSRGLLVDPTWTLSIPGLSDIGYSVDIEYNMGLTSVAFATSGPATIGSQLDIEDNYELVSISAPGLQSVEYDFRITENGELDVFDFTGLQSIGQDLSMHYNGNPESFVADFAALTSVGASVDIGGNLGLEELHFDALTNVGNAFNINDNDDLVVLTANALLKVPGFLCVADNSALPSFSLAALTNTPNDAYIQSNNSLTTFDLGALQAMAIPPPPPLSASVVVIPTATSAADLFISGNDALTGFDLSSLQDVGKVDLFQNDGLVTLPSMASLLPGSSVRISSNAALANVDGLSGVTQLFGVHVLGNGALTSLSGLGSLAMANFLEINTNDVLTAVNQLTSLTQVYESLLVHDNATLTEITISSLTTVGEGSATSSTFGNIQVSLNPLLTSMGFSSLATIDGGITVQSNALASLGAFSALTSPVDRVFIDGNAVLTDVSGLSGIGDTDAAPAIAATLWVANNPSLCEEDVDVLHAAIDAKNPGSAIGGAYTNTLNLSCSQQDN